mgnify:CR=1 FL=1
MAQKNSGKSEDFERKTSEEPQNDNSFQSIKIVEKTRNLDLPKTQPVKQLEGKPNSSFNDDSLGQASIPSQFIASQQEFYKKPVNIKLNPMPPLANTGQFNFPDMRKTIEAKQTIET